MVLGIFGAGGLGREVLEITRQLSEISPRWDKVVFVEDLEETALANRQGRLINDTRVYDYNQFVSEFDSSIARFAIAVGEPVVREKMYEKVKKDGYALETIIHPSVHIPESTVVAEGVIIQTYAFISANAKIEENAVIQNMATVGHDTIIGRSSIVAMYSGVAGHCTVGKRTYLAINVTVREKINIGNDTIVGMGSVVQRDIPDNVIAMGNPARPMKMKDESVVFH